MSNHTLELCADALEITASVDEDTDLLEAMREAGLSVRKSCRNGVCGLCKCRLVSGDITYLWRKPHGLWEKHIAAGLILPCIAFARSNLALDQIPLVEDKPSQD